MTMLTKAFKEVTPTIEVIPLADLDFISEVQNSFDGRKKRLDFSVSMLESLVPKQEAFIAEHGDYKIGFNFKTKANNLASKIDEFKTDVRDDLINYINNRYQLKIARDSYSPSENAQALYLEILSHHKYSFDESGFELFKSKIKDELEYRKPDLKSNKLVIARLLQVEPQFCFRDTGLYRIPYSYSDRVQVIIDCLHYFEKSKLTKGAFELKEFRLNETVSIGLSKVNGFKFYKNGRMDIEFLSNSDAQAFVNLWKLELV